MNKNIVRKMIQVDNEDYNQLVKIAESKDLKVRYIFANLIKEFIKKNSE